MQPGRRHRGPRRGRVLTAASLQTETQGLPVTYLPFAIPVLVPAGAVDVAVLAPPPSDWHALPQPTHCVGSPEAAEEEASFRLVMPLLPFLPACKGCREGGPLRHRCCCGLLPLVRCLQRHQQGHLLSLLYPGAAASLSTLSGFQEAQFPHSG